MTTETQRVIDSYKKAETANARSVSIMPFANFFDFSRFVRHAKENAMVHLIWESGWPIDRIMEARILDVGCGDGSTLRNWLDYGAKVYNCFGVDVIPERIEIGKTVCPKMELLNISGEELPYRDNYFDIITFNTVLSAVFDIEVRKKMLCEAKRVLKSGGIILVYDQEINNERVKSITVKELAELSGISWLSVKIIPKTYIKRTYPELYKAQEKGKGLMCWMAIAKKGA